MESALVSDMSCRSAVINRIGHFVEDNNDFLNFALASQRHLALLNSQLEQRNVTTILPDSLCNLLVLAANSDRVDDFSRLLKLGQFALADSPVAQLFKTGGGQGIGHLWSLLIPHAPKCLAALLDWIDHESDGVFSYDIDTMWQRALLCAKADKRLDCLEALVGRQRKPLKVAMTCAYFMSRAPTAAAVRQARALTLQDIPAHVVVKTIKHLLRDNRALPHVISEIVEATNFPVDFPCTETGETALTLATKILHLPLMSALLHRGASPLCQLAGRRQDEQEQQQGFPSAPISDPLPALLQVPLPARGWRFDPDIDFLDLDYTMSHHHFHLFSTHREDWRQSHVRHASKTRSAMDLFMDRHPRCLHVLSNAALTELAQAYVHTLGTFLIQSIRWYLPKEVQDTVLVTCTKPEADYSEDPQHASLMLMWLDTLKGHTLRTFLNIHGFALEQDLVYVFSLLMTQDVVQQAGSESGDPETVLYGCIARYRGYYEDLFGARATPGADDMGDGSEEDEDEARDE